MATTLAQQQATLETQLEEVRTAISARLTGAQSISNEGESTVYPDMNALNMRESMLVKQLNEINAKIERRSTGRIKVAEF